MLVIVYGWEDINIFIQKAFFGDIQKQLYLIEIIICSTLNFWIANSSHLLRIFVFKMWWRGICGSGKWIILFIFWCFCHDNLMIEVIRSSLTSHPVLMPSGQHGLCRNINFSKGLNVLTFALQQPYQKDLQRYGTDGDVEKYDLSLNNHNFYASTHNHYVW